MDIRILSRVSGVLLIALGLIFLIPGVFSLYYAGGITKVFLYTSILSTLSGAVLWWSQKNYEGELNNRTALALVALIWIFASLLGALPYYLSAAVPTFYDALFEATSGFTGTGATVLYDVESQEPALLLWRSITQWLGGMGIIVFFLAILPLLGLGGVQLFRAEMAGPHKERAAPRIKEAANRLLVLYVIFTAVLGVLLYMAGMGGFDAVNHALTGAATGGFSTKNAGIAAFDSALIDYIIILFMLIGAINFIVHFKLLVRREISTLLDTELKWFFGIIFIMTLITTISNWGVEYASLAESFRHSLFVITSIATSTGYTHTDYTRWADGLQFMIILLMVMGGMSGSTAGGLKCIRLVTAFKQLVKELKRLIHPNAILTVRINSRSVSENVINAIWGFIFLYFFIFSIAAVLLMFQGLDLLSASTATVAALSNIGPAHGSLGPYDSYALLSDGAKLILSACMILGRLEFYTVVVLFTVAYWKK